MLKAENTPARGSSLRFARRATLRRSLRLLGSFRFEQTDPALFYGGLAADSTAMIADFYADLTGRSLDGATILDVGGGPGYFADEFTRTGARYIPVEPDPSEMHAAGLSVAGAVRGSGMALPFRDDALDICFSSNVAEHVSKPWVMADEMVRVTRPGGLIVLSYTVWHGPFGGHETGPWHYLGGEYAAGRGRGQPRRGTQKKLGRGGVGGGGPRGSLPYGWPRTWSRWRRIPRRRSCSRSRRRSRPGP
ncbi:class I SAM-dependent methyltransferase, partial [Nocardia abscessus]|uniref:class I SAM-dependent methyltransferase n=1 Tax=Nocardia abscessus TaxID=120957 RepID=UPI0024578C88